MYFTLLLTAWKLFWHGCLHPFIFWQNICNIVHKSLFIWTFAWPFNATNDNANKQVTSFLFRDKWNWKTEKETEQLPFNKNQLLGLDDWGSHLAAIIYHYLLCMFPSVDEVSYLYFMMNTGNITSTQNIKILQQRNWYHLCIERKDTFNCLKLLMKMI